jgi:SAM-dependent methyltransferase
VTDQHTAQRARSFGAAADEYERARPTYPDAAVDWLIPSGVRTVLDLGAGTGKFTRALVSRSLDVIAVEPLSEMREILQQQLLLEMVSSRSYFITAADSRKEQYLADVRALVESDPELAGGESFDMPYRTYCFRAALSAKY